MYNLSMKYGLLYSFSVHLFEGDREGEGVGEGGRGRERGEENGGVDAH